MSSEEKILEMLSAMQSDLAGLKEDVAEIREVQAQHTEILKEYKEILEEHSIAHKTGGLPGVVHDAAIVDAGREPFLLCFLGSGVDVPAYGRMIQDASFRIWNQIQQDSP